MKRAEYATRTATADFDTFYRASHQRIAQALGVTLGNPDLGAEATDEAMARAYLRWATVQKYENPAGWVYRVGLNYARSLHRRLSRRLPWVEETASSLPPIADPSIRDAIQALDIKMRSVVVCRLLLDWSVGETAAALDIAPGTVKSRLSRGLEQLSRTLGHLDPARPDPPAPAEMIDLVQPPANPSDERQHHG